LLVSPLCLTLCVFGLSSMSLTCIIGQSSASVTCVVDICSASLAHAVCLSSVWLSCIVNLSSLSHWIRCWQILNLSLSCVLTIDNISLSLLHQLPLEVYLLHLRQRSILSHSLSHSLVLTASPLFASLLLSLVALLSLSLACRWPLLSSLSLAHTCSVDNPLCVSGLHLSILSLLSFLCCQSWPGQQSFLWKKQRWEVIFIILAHFGGTLNESFHRHWMAGPAYFDLGWHGSLAGLKFANASKRAMLATYT